MTFWHASGRFWAMAILMGVSFGLESVICTFTARHQTLHDIVTSCVVVDSE